jgi:hypothetical protein
VLLVFKQFEEGVADARPYALDSLDLVDRSPVDGQPAEVRPHDLDEGIRSLDKLGQQLSLGNRRRDPGFKTLIRLAKRPLHLATVIDIKERSDIAEKLAAFREPGRCGIDGPTIDAICSPDAELDLIVGVLCV